MRNISLVLIGISLGLPLVAVSQTKMVHKVQDRYGKYSSILWRDGQWTDTKFDKKLKPLREAIDKLPARTRKVNEADIKKRMAAYRQNFMSKPSYETFFPWLCICGKYPDLAYYGYSELQTYLFEYRGLACYEYARAAFIAIGNIHKSTINLPKGFDKRFRPFAKNDWLLTEALISLYATESSHFSKDDLWWGWKEAKKLSETMPDGVFGFGRLRLDAASPLMTTSPAFMDQEIAYTDYLLKGDLFDADGKRKLRNYKEFWLAVKKRMEDYKKKHPGG